jgi:RES domain-containing protein
MALRRTARDSQLLDAVEALPVRAFEGTAWRAVRDGRDPVQGSSVGGRWDDQTFDVLYTSMHPDGAVAELHFHLFRGQPVVPSLAIYVLHELRVAISKCIYLETLEELARLGMRAQTFGQLSYAEREQEYPRTQEIAEAAHFHGREAMIVPSARAKHLNIIIFTDVIGPSAIEAIRSHGKIDWPKWKPPA